MSPIKSALIFLAALTTAALCSLDSNCVTSSHWVQHKTKFNKRYSKAEESSRCAKFAANVEKINKHNSQKLTWLMGVNHLTDWTDEEFNKLLGARVELSNVSAKFYYNTSSGPQSLDLSTTNGVGPIRDQGQCGSCWTFSTCAAVEYAYWKKTGYAGDLSEQHLVDCVYGSEGGCEGGWMPTAIDHIAKRGGIAWESAYPYTAISGQCKKNSSPYLVGLSQSTINYEQVAPDNNSIKNALNKFGVLSICVDASNWGSYKSGIFYSSPGIATAASPLCNHAVNLVGYGQENGIPFYKIRNSWGKTWGEDGYMRVDARRDKNGTMLGGINLDYVFYPILN